MLLCGSRFVSVSLVRPFLPRHLNFQEDCHFLSESPCLGCLLRLLLTSTDDRTDRHYQHANIATPLRMLAELVELNARRRPSTSLFECRDENDQKSREARS